MSLGKIGEKLIMEHQLYKESYQRSMLTVFVLGIITALAFFFSAIYFEDFIVQQTNTIAEQMLDENNKEMTNVQTFFSILLNNLFVGGMIILCGFIPLYGLPFVYGVLSFASVGIIAGYGIIMKYNVLQTMLIAFIPHAVIEIIPILYSVAIGTYINKNIVKKVFLKKRKSEKITKMLGQSITSYIIIIIPLFFLAALVEAFITSVLVDIYL
ncbi:stage II sporulation protein M [Jeotgalibacillus aurantiacus]|uniref:stage II sporulation protein M n=1 Tax=Jeotgalibacillus aurantiacus TaxID=2763266 RepID=UPI001D09B9E6|nr:stage II sporulation protein M [Jeotgalibacillus aurantiacus]